MEHTPEKARYTLLCVIVNNGLGSRILRAAKGYGVTGGTVVIGRGTIKNRFWQALEVCDVRKEIVLMLCEQASACRAMEQIGRDFKFHKPHHGIAFCMPVSGVLGARSCNCDFIESKRKGEGSMYQAVFVIVDRGRAEMVIDAAAKAGSRGGTIINARGSGIHGTGKLFAMDIEPEKEIVLIISRRSQTPAIAASIRENLEIDLPGKGIVFIQDVGETYGLY